jgi:hypothetical protein
VTERGVVQDDVRKCLVDLGMVVSRWATGTPVWLNGTPQVSSPTLRCSVHVSGISDVSDVSPRRFHRMASWSVSIEIACDAGRLSRPILLCKDGKILFDKPSIESWSSLLPTRRHLLQEDGSFATYAPIEADKPIDKDDKRKKESLPTLCASWSMSTV